MQNQPDMSIISGPALTRRQISARAALLGCGPSCHWAPQPHPGAKNGVSACICMYNMRAVTHVHTLHYITFTLHTYITLHYIYITYIHIHTYTYVWCITNIWCTCVGYNSCDSNFSESAIWNGDLWRIYDWKWACQTNKHWETVGYHRHQVCVNIYI